MLILNETNYSNGKVTLYDNENNVVSNGHVEVYVGTNKVSTFSLDAYGQGTPSITAGIFYRFEVFDSVGELVSILEPVSLGESSSGGVTPAALEAETAARIAGDENMQGQINGKVDKSYVDDKLGQIAYDKRVVDERLNDTYTKEQVDGFIRNWSGYVVIPFGQQKPAASEAQLGKIYLVQVSNDPDVRDQYEEWISDGTAWSLIGTMAIDLSPYDKIVDAEAREKAISDALAAHISDTTKHITEAERTKWNAAVQPSQLATVATTGSYNDLTGKPTIPPAITVDSAMSSTSTNPVQNKVVNAELSGKLNHITDASKITGTIQSFTSWKISIVSRSEFNGSFVRLWDVTSFKDGSIVNLNNDQVNFKGFFIAGKNQGIGSPEVVEIACKVAFNQTTHYLKSSSKDCGPCICSREEDGVKRYYLGIYYPATLYSSQGASLCGFFSSYASDESFSHSNFLGDYTPWQTWPSQESLWTKEFSWTGSVDANKLFSARQILVNLGSGSGAYFDGSANVNPGVYGTLPIAKGGTGASTAAAARTNLGLGSLATKSSVTDSDISGTIADSHIASASAWNGKQDALSFTTADEITEILGGLE